jgi:hypothetical protein
MMLKTLLLLILVGSYSSADLSRYEFDASEVLLLEQLKLFEKSLTDDLANNFKHKERKLSSVEDATAMKSCVESLCKNHPVTLAKIEAEVDQLLSENNGVFNQEILPFIKTIAKNESLDNIQQAKSLLAWVSTAPVLSKPGPIRVFNMYVALAAITQFKFKVDDKGKTIIDSKLSRPFFAELSDEQYSRRVIVTQKLIDSYLDKAIASTDPGQIKLIYGEKFKERINSVIDSFQGKVSEIKKDQELLFLTDWSGFKNLASTEDLRSQFVSDVINPQAIQNLNLINSRLNFFMMMSSDQVLKKALESPPIDLQKFSLNQGVENLLKDRVIEQEKIFKGQLKSVIYQCKKTFSLAQTVLPSQEENLLFEKKAEAIKKDFIEKTKPFVCENSVESYQNTLQNLKPKLPQTKSQFLANMKQSLGRLAQDSKKLKSNFEKLKNSKNKDAVLSMNLAALRKSSNDSLPGLDSLCLGLSVDVVPDAVAFLSPSFVVGPLAVRNKELEGIVHHELAHQLYYFLGTSSSCENSRFGKIRACLLSNHDELNKDEVAEQIRLLLGGSISRFEIEDFADLMSSLGDHKQNNFACVFAQKTKFEDYKKLSLRREGKVVPHSSDLFRLLHLNFIKKGEVPTTCTQALSAQGESIQFTNCLLK